MAIRSPLSFGHAPDGADTSSDPPLAGHLLLKEKALGGVLGTASTVGAAIGRLLFYRGNDNRKPSPNGRRWHGVSRD